MDGLTSGLSSNFFVGFNVILTILLYWLHAIYVPLALGFIPAHPLRTLSVWNVVLKCDKASWTCLNVWLTKRIVKILTHLTIPD